MTLLVARVFVFISLSVLATVLNAAALIQSTQESARGMLFNRRRDLQIHSETVISAISIRNNSLQEVLTKIGKPTRVEVSSPRIEWGRTLSTHIYKWQKKSILL